MIDWELLAANLRKPSGEMGIITAEKMNESNEKLYEVLVDTIVDSDILTNKSEVLEIGFGNGAFFEYLNDNLACSKLTGLDFSEEMCALAIQNNPKLIEAKKLEIVCGSIAENSIADHSFDLIIAINVIYFWDNFEENILGIKRMLKPQGCFAIGYRPASNMIQYPFTQFGFRLYENEELDLLMDQYGFEKIKFNTLSYTRKAADDMEYESVDNCGVYQLILG